MASKFNKKILWLTAGVAFLILMVFLAWIFLDPLGGISDSPSDPEEPRFESTEDKPYDTSRLEETESQKVQTEDEDLLYAKSVLVPMIAEGKWAGAQAWLENFLNEHSRLTESGKVLTRYLNDLTVMNQMAEADVSTYETLFRTFEAPETFLASMTYYPYSVKTSGFLSYSSLVPITQTNNVAIHMLEPEDTGEVMKELELNFPGIYKAAWKQDFSVDGFELTAYYGETKEGHWHIFRVETEDEDSFFMTVKQWEELLVNKADGGATSENI